MLPDVLALVGGLALLVAAASALVRGAAALALRLGLTPLVVGLTVVAFGTSAPELVVSVQAALAGAGGIAVGNVVGSNVANIGLILAVAVLVRPIASDPALLRRDLPALVAATALAVALLWDRALGRGEGTMLLVGLVAYLVWSVRTARREQAAVELPVAAPAGPAWRDALFVVAGLGGLVWGADLFVGGAVRLAEAAGVSNAVIGLTVVAVGTSLPELATTVVAAARGEGEIAAGSVVGSNLFNLLGILGVGALVEPLVAPGLRPVDLAVMAAFTVALVPMMLSGRRLVRAESGVLLAGYVGYMAFLLLQPV
ncbi:calcium/sodium antiporter [Rubrivirga sp. S365]|uniref:Calcium/sodium antiporter n=1 Tax=Rubrivirga litoralis TaxID=3075598 RepID=A0ABU3BVE9_9BACT|nr:MULTISPECIES: calcium/sodium antiporter [unclassified Rubrivirga]MDT0633126.1 calcium/sodium antiporter [Rubrivirga sp. F394]MDT7855321.1 calcium/sodium antiporter [Rubrivirga sp. S365]